MLIYRSVKGSPLTHEEVDNNFRELATRLETLETSPPDAEGLASIQVEQSELRFQGSRGTSFGSFSLPKLFWNPRGVWKANTAYVALDVTSFQDALYVCKTSHTSGASFSETAWTLLFSLNFGKAQKEEIAPEPKSKKSNAPQGIAAPPFEKEDLHPYPPVGTVVLLMDAPEQPELFYWEGQTWRRVKDGLDLSELAQNQ
ncbi:MAG: hypothetical protein ACRCTK_01135 [Alphaproteobacteria bacterium]